ncbi:MAG: adenine deaminase C-terminal domain-containing protein [Methanospirillum sp.]
MRELVRAARGEGTADLALLNAVVFNPFLGEWEETALGIHRGRVLGPGPYRARRELDLGGARVVPGLIDAHVHVESSLLSPFEYARLAAAHGTTTVVADPHEIANVLGVPGIEYMLACRPRLPVDLLLTLPSCVPATPVDVGGATIGAGELATLAGREGVIGLGEVMNVPGLLGGDPDLGAKVALFRNVDGHAPGLGGPDLNAYAIAGAQSDHEAATAEEGRDRLARGMYLFLREGSTERNIAALLPLVTPATAPRCAFCTDDRHADLILRDGLIDDCIRRALDGGLELELALRMATLSAAERFGLVDRGALEPGRRADFCVLTEDDDFSIARTFVCGAEVVDPGPKPAPVPPPARRMECRLPAPGDLLPAVDGCTRVIELVPGQVRTRAVDLSVHPGSIPDIARDLLPAVVCDAYRGTGTGVGIVRGFGLSRGAIASTVAHDAHQVVAVGAEPAAMAAAVAAVVGSRGGLAAVGLGETTLLPLPVAGLMSDRPYGEVVDGLDRLAAHAARLGAVPGAFMHLSFLALTVIPERRLTERGVFDHAVFGDVPLSC